MAAPNLELAPRGRFAIIVPYRNRAAYLEVLLDELPRYLENVNRLYDYSIYVAEQLSEDVFNLSLSRNIAAKAALEDGGFDYLVFHDVDVIPLAGVDYGPSPGNVAWFLTAGSCKLQSADYERVNGFNPSFVGWGDEDVEFYHRLESFGCAVREWHRSPDSRDAVVMNLDWPELTPHEAASRSQRYFGYGERERGPRFVSWNRRLQGREIERHDRTQGWAVEAHRQKNSALWAHVRALPLDAKRQYFARNGLNRMSLEGVRRERRGAVRWLSYETERVLVSPERSSVKAGQRATRGEQGGKVEVKVASFSVAYGELGVGGELGYEGKRVDVNQRADTALLSAHAPSEVLVRAAPGSELCLQGALNADVRGRDVAARFLVENRRGQRLVELGSARPEQPTREVRVAVPPDGALVLRCEARPEAFCHSVWLLHNAELALVSDESQPRQVVTSAAPPAATSSTRGTSIRILSWRLATGRLATDGRLGHGGGCCPKPLCHAQLDGLGLISASGPSRLEIECDFPIELFGFLNASAPFVPETPLEFWVDWNFLGSVAVPGGVSASKRLAPGKHVLVAACAASTSRHTLWAWRPLVSHARPSLSVLTLAAYPEHAVPRELAILARSAARHGVELTVCCVGEAYQSHAHMKITRLRQIIQSLDTPHVMYTDARDCLVLAGAARIESRFESLRAPITISTEAECWPIGDAAWARRFPVQPGGCNWLNAGQWMGERDALLDALGRLEDLDARSQRAPAPDDPRDLALCRRLSRDDQLLWQVAWIDGLVKLAPDYEGRLFRNVSTLDSSLVDNRDFDFDREGVVFKASGERPCVLHFSGRGAQYCMHQWGGLLGAY